MATVLNVTGIGYMLGGLVFGIALFRARILARSAAALLAVGTIATVSLAVLPEAFNRPMAVPVGLALIGLGRLAVAQPGRRVAATAVEPPASSTRPSDDAPSHVGAVGAHAPAARRARSWPVPVGLLLLSLVPLLAGTFRVVQLLGGPELIPADHRFAGFPLPADRAHRRRRRSTWSSAPSSSCRGSAAGTSAGTAAPAGCWPWPGCSSPARRSG